MTKMNKFLALLPVVAFAAGCNGVAPGGPSAVTSNDATELVSGGASTMSRSCKGLTGIDLAVDQSDDTMLWVGATYVFSDPLGTPCPAPAWRSDREGLVVDKANPFRAGFFRLAGGRASIQATGPNGVHNLIDVNLDPPANSLVPALCDDATGLTVTMVSSPDDSMIVLLAQYESIIPETPRCTVPPVWVADRRGLTIDPKNPFLASIEPMNDVKTLVEVTGANRLTGSIVF